MTYGFWAPTNNHTRFDVGSPNSALALRGGGAPAASQPAAFLSRASVDATAAFRAAQPLPASRPLTARERGRQYHDVRVGKCPPVIVDERKRVPAPPPFWAPDAAHCRHRMMNKDFAFLRRNADTVVRQESRRIPEPVPVAQGIVPHPWRSTALSGGRSASATRTKAAAYDAARKRGLSL
eukprot:EG_transcript_24678